MKKTTVLVAFLLITGTTFAQSKKKEDTVKVVPTVIQTPPLPEKKLWYLVLDDDYMNRLYKLVVTSTQPFPDVNPVKEMLDYQARHQPNLSIPDTAKGK